MKFLLLSDFHLTSQQYEGRIDDIIETQFNKVRFIIDTAIENEAIILDAGDLSDRPRSWPLLPKLINLLKDGKKKSGQDHWFCGVYGQHDIYMYNEETNPKTNLGVLIAAGFITELSQMPLISGYSEAGRIAIYGAGWQQQIPKPISKEDFNILVTHRSVGVKSLYDGHEYEDAKRFLKKHKFDLILVGDIHRQFAIEDGRRMLVNTGCLIRKTAEMYNYEYKPSCFLFDTDTLKLTKIIIPHAPAEEVLSREHLEKQKAKEDLLDEFVASVKDIDYDVDFFSNLQKFITENNTEQEVQDIIAQEIEEAKR